MNTIEVFVSCGVWLPNNMMCDQGRLRSASCPWTSLLSTQVPGHFVGINKQLEHAITNPHAKIVDPPAPHNSHPLSMTQTQATE